MELSIEDTDPQRARDMVTAAREKIEDIAQKIIKESQYMLLEALKEGINNQEEILQVKGDSLTKLKDKYQIYDLYHDTSSHILELLSQEFYINNTLAIVQI